MSKEKILLVDDEDLLRWSVKTKLEQWGYRVIEAESGAQAIEGYEHESPPLVLLDIHLLDRSGLEVLKSIKQINPQAVVLMVTAQTTLENAVAALRLGAFDFISKPIDHEELRVAVRNGLETARLRETVARVQTHNRQRFSFSSIVGNSPKMRELLEIVKRVAESEASCIVLQGESGVGKDLVAKAIHYQSRRADRPFLAINCAAIPETLMESEMFGHEKGAFTDAHAQKKGAFELADGGTIFLDEIADLPLGLQSKLLRVLEEQSFRRVGGVRDTNIDVRVVAASNRDLEDAVKQKQFRPDLYYRLGVVQINIPPLRERREDVLLLADYFVKHFNVKMNKAFDGLSVEAQAIFLQYHWPGNVRELRNVIEHAMIFEEERQLTPHHLPARILHQKSNSPALGDRSSLEVTGRASLKDVEQDLIVQALKDANWNQTRAAALLGITRDTLRYKMKKFGLSRPGESGSSTPSEETASAEV